MWVEGKKWNWDEGRKNLGKKRESEEKKRVQKKEKDGLRKAGGVGKVA